MEREQIILHLPRRLKKRLQKEARAEGVSLNDHILSILYDGCRLSIKPSKICPPPPPIHSLRKEAPINDSNSDCYHCCCGQYCLSDK